MVTRMSTLWTIWSGSRIWFLPLKPMESLRIIFSTSSSSTHLLEMLRTSLSSYHHDLLHHGLTTRTHSCVAFLMMHALRTWGAELLHSHMSLHNLSEVQWIRFKSYQRECSHHGFNEVQLLSTFFRGITLAYQMALDTASEGNFNTTNPK